MIYEKFTTAVSEAVDEEEEDDGETEPLATVLSEMEGSEFVRKYPTVWYQWQHDGCNQVHRLSRRWRHSQTLKMDIQEK